MKIANMVLSGLIAVAAAAAPTQSQPPQLQVPPPAPTALDLGNFSLSLAVRDINASKAFYEKLGFVQVGGNVSQRWVVMKNGDTKLGLFQGMFDRNVLTFNPGRGSDGRNVERFEDVRAIQRRLKSAGLDTGTDIASPSGPAYFMVTDPDGNPILIDQHR